MRIKRHIVLLVCLLACAVVFAQEAKTSLLRVEEVSEGRLKMHFEMHGIQVTLTGWNFSVMECQGMNFGNGLVGAPNLPTASTLIRLPAGSRLTVGRVVADSVEAEDFVPEGFPIAPVTRAWSKTHGWPGYEPDEKIYATDEYHRGGDLVEVEHLGRMGGEEVYRLTVRPVAYNPVQRSVIGWERVDCELIVEGDAPYPTLWDDKVLLIVSRPEFGSGLQPFVQWKKQEGYWVEELYVETHKRDSIKEMMRPYFQNDSPLRPSPNYILLVGDVAQIQSFIGETRLEDNNHITDLYYADFSGDYLPEAMLGRWPVNDTAELRVVVEKTLRYEQFKDMDTTQLKRMLLVAGEENSGQAPLTTNGQVNYVSREVKLAHTEMDTLCYHNPQSGSQIDPIVTDIGFGASLLNYTAHGTVGGWSSPSLSIGRVAAAGGTQPMVYVNNCCLTNSFGGTCFGEQLLRLPVSGAVGVIGATNSTLWYEDYYWAVGPKWPVTLDAVYDSAARGAFDALVGRRPTIATLGELLTAGNLAVTAFGTGYAKFYWEIYCLLGDPTLKPWIGVPQSIDLSLTNGLYNGESEVYVGGTTGATVTAMQGDEVLGRATIGPSGTAVISLSRTLDTLPLILTATGTSLWPRIDTLTVETDIDFGATLRDVNVGDSVVNCIVENIGHLRIDSLKIVFTQIGDDTLNGALLQEQIAIVDSLLPNERMSVSLPVNITAIGALPQWQATLMAWEEGSGTLCDLTLRHRLPVAYPTLSLKLLDTADQRTRRILPGSTYRLEALVEGSADSMLLKAEALPSGEWSTTDNILEFSTPDTLCALAIDGTLYLGRWQGRQRHWLEAGERIDGFEHGFDSHPWRNNGRVAWVLDSTESHSGRFSLRSGAIDHGQQTKICLEVEMVLRDTIGYWVKTSTETPGDKLVFSVDGRDFTPEAWGIGDWRRRIHVLDAGKHTLCWRYAKDASGSQGSDCVWIDDIQVPLSLWDSAYAWNCVTPTVGIEDLHSNSHLSLTIYPNPTMGEVWMEGLPGTAVSVTDAMGRTVATFTMDREASHCWNASALPAGIYFATSILRGQKNTQKIVLIKP